MAIVEAKVKPERLKDDREAYRRYWWQHAEKRVDLWSTIAGLERVLVIHRSHNMSRSPFSPSGMVYSHRL